ncbi:hypothetical protein PTKIN_Ptkin11bG0060900 [Pterospermum kingtungense]
MADTNQVIRPTANYPQDAWADCFLSLPFSDSELESYSKHVEALKGTVEAMLMVSENDPLDKIYLINSLNRLGVWYHFESKIEEQLSHLFITLMPKLLEDNNCDLHKVAVTFQVFRFHGYKMPCDVFSKFQDADGKFKEALIGDIKGMITLYEACHFKTNGEIILDEALAFTKRHLGSLANQSISPHLRVYIENALFRPYHHSMQIFEAKQYISFYEKDESKNDVLLKFAKCNFNWLQLLLRPELNVLLRWYDKLKLKSKLPYARHRMVESFFYSLGVYFQPCYAVARNILAKHTCLIGFLDDVYEAHGFYEELKHLTDALRRFDISAMDDLPADYLKTIYEIILYVHDESENKIRKEGRSFSISYAKTEYIKYAIAEDVETRRRHEGYEATFDEYLENGLYTSATIAAMAQVFIGVPEADENAYEWLINNNNKFPRALQKATRLYNDIVTNEVEEKRGLINTATQCYMKQYNVSREEATKAFRAIIAAAWEDINEGCLRPTRAAMPVVRSGLNYQRMLDFAYRDLDSYTANVYWKDIIPKVLTEPVPID